MHTVPSWTVYAVSSRTQALEPTHVERDGPTFDLEGRDQFSKFRIYVPMMPFRCIVHAGAPLIMMILHISTPTCRDPLSRNSTVKILDKKIKNLYDAKKIASLHLDLEFVSSVMENGSEAWITPEHMHTKAIASQSSTL